MTKAELLRKSAGIVSALIKAKTLPFSVLEEAHKALGQIVATTKALDPGDAVTQEVACDINSVMERMESFRSGYCSNDPSQTKTVTNKSFTLPEFAVFVKTEVDGALAETTVAATLKRLHTLSGQIETGSKGVSNLPGLNKAESMEDTTVITIPVTVDPAQIIPTDKTTPAAAAQSGTPAGDSAQFSTPGGNPGPVADSHAANGSIATQGTGNPADGGNYQASKSAPATPESTLDTVVATVEKTTAAPAFDGWPMDVNAPKRKSDVHFGKDPLRHRA